MVVTNFHLPLRGRPTPFHVPVIVRVRVSGVSGLLQGGEHHLGARRPQDVPGPEVLVDCQISSLQCHQLWLQTCLYVIISGHIQIQLYLVVWRRLPDLVHNPAPL